MLKKILTKDGSYTFYNPDLKETFHSKNGALTESLHVYISEGLEYWIKNNSKVELCNIFEMGFGTGLNAILTNRFSKANQKKITYCSIDKFPLTNNQIKMVSLNDLSEIENYIINSSWNKTHKITSLFSLFKLNDDFLSIKNKQTYDVVFYDAFAYHAQPNIWSEKAIKISTFI